MKLLVYTDGKYIYFVRAGLGKTYAVFKQIAGPIKAGGHKYRSSSNKWLEEKGAVQDYLDKIAEKNGWEEYDDSEIR